MDRDQVVSNLLEKGLSRSEIARRLGVDRDTVSRVAARVGFPSRARRPSSIDWAVVREYYATGNSIEACKRRFGFSSSTWDAAVCRGDIVPRRAVTTGEAPGITRQRVSKLLDEGLRPKEIARRLGLSTPTVCYHARKLGVSAREPPARRYDWDQIREAYESGWSVRDCMAHFGFSYSSWADAVARGAVKPRARQIPLETLLVNGRSQTSRTHLKRRLLIAGLKDNRCEGCGITDWRGRPLNMELQHVNGEGTDNRLENLRLLCGNCHSQTDNWGGRGLKQNGNRPKVGAD